MRSRAPRSSTRSADEPSITTRPRWSKHARSATVERLARVLLDEEHADAVCVRRATDRLEQSAHHERCEAQRQLVDEEQPRSRGQGPRQREHLLLAAGPQPGATSEERAELREQVEGDVRSGPG